jgi:hypothetical protein
MRKRSIAGRLAVASGLLVLPVLLGGWDDDTYLSRRDSISRSFGDANAINQATQTVDPWPEHAKNNKSASNGRRAAKAVQRYEQGKVLQPHGLNTTTVIENTSPGGQADTTIQK